VGDIGVKALKVAHCPAAYFLLDFFDFMLFLLFPDFPDFCDFLDFKLFPDFLDLALDILLKGKD